MKFKLALAQCRHDTVNGALSVVERYVNAAVEAGADLLVFPESLMTPYEKELGRFLAEAEPADGPFAQAVSGLARDNGLWIVYTVNEANPGGNPFNTALVADAEGNTALSYRKVHLFDSATTRESDRMASGNELAVPVDSPFGRIGVGICYDLRFPEVARFASTRDAKLMLYPAAWVSGERKVGQWQALLRARAVENAMFVAGLSRCDEGYIGMSCVYDPWGDLVAQAGPDEQLLVCEIDTDLVDEARKAIPVLSHRRPETYVEP